MELPESDPVLVSGARQTQAFGGSLLMSPAARHHVSFFPPTFASSLTITKDGKKLGTVTFPPSPSSRCDLAAKPPFTVTRCGSLVGLEWESGLSIDASDVAGMDVGVTSEGPSGLTALGFFYEGVSDGPNGLVVHFSTRRPVSRRVDIVLRSVDLHEKSGEPDRILTSLESRRFVLRVCATASTDAIRTACARA